LHFNLNLVHQSGATIRQDFYQRVNFDGRAPDFSVHTAVRPQPPYAGVKRGELRNFMKVGARKYQPHCVNHDKRVELLHTSIPEPLLLGPLLPTGCIGVFTMAKCSRCGSETQLYVSQTPLCDECDDKMNMPDAQPQEQPEPAQSNPRFVEQ